MTKKSLQKGWSWELVDDLDYWKRPDGFVMNLPYILGRPPKRIFDLGCGIGRHTIYFSSLGYDVTAYDISEEAVKKTKEWLQKEGLQAQVLLGKMTSINQPDNSFDLVLAFNVIYHAFKEEIKETIEEIYRILKPKGYFFVTILTKDPNEQFYPETKIINKQTILKTEDPEKDVPHFFSYVEDVLEFFADFEIKDFYYKEWYSPPYSVEKIKKRRGSGHYILLAQKI